MEARFLLDTNICIYIVREFARVGGLEAQNWAM
jgi:hypothetical protein